MRRLFDNFDDVLGSHQGIANSNRAVVGWSRRLDCRIVKDQSDLSCGLRPAVPGQRDHGNAADFLDCLHRQAQYLQTRARLSRFPGTVAMDHGIHVFPPPA